MRFSTKVISDVHRNETPRERQQRLALAAKAARAARFDVEAWTAMHEDAEASLQLGRNVLLARGWL